MLTKILAKLMPLSVAKSFIVTDKLNRKKLSPPSGAVAVTVR
jgi:CBS-domain-containing membrane protein